MHSEVEITRRHVEAVARMLLRRKTLRPGVAIVAGGPLDVLGRLTIGQVARETDTDLIHLALDTIDGEYRMTAITVVAPRDALVHIHPGCRLSQIGRQTVIVPPDHVRGHFVLACDQLIHKPARPDRWREGISLAERRLAELVARGARVSGQITIHEATR